MKMLHEVSKMDEKYCRKFVKIYSFVKSEKNLFTVWKVCRVHVMLQKPRTMIGSCASDIKISTIFCNSIGNEYHLHWQNSSQYLSNSLVTAEPYSQYMETDANDQKIKINGEINSIVVESSSDFEI